MYIVHVFNLRALHSLLPSYSNSFKMKDPFHKSKLCISDGQFRASLHTSDHVRNNNNNNGIDDWLTDCSSIEVLDVCPNQPSRSLKK